MVFQGHAAGHGVAGTAQEMRSQPGFGCRAGRWQVRTQFPSWSISKTAAVGKVRDQPCCASLRIQGAINYIIPC